MDRDAEALALAHGERLKCKRGCAACCVDGITVFEIEAERIRRDHARLLESEAPRAPGACAFLDADDACRIYASRPYVCRTQGLPLRWIDVAEDGATVELRDICSLNADGHPITMLSDDRCFTLGPYEARLRDLQLAASRRLDRVALRALFRADGGKKVGDGS